MVSKMSLLVACCLDCGLISGVSAQVYDPVDQVYRYRGTAVPKFILVEQFFLDGLYLHSNAQNAFKHGILSPLGITPDSGAAIALLGAAREVEDIPRPNLDSLQDNPIEFERVQREGLRRRVMRIKEIYMQLLSDLEAQGVDPRLLDQDYLEKEVRPGVSVTVWPAPDWAMEIIASFEDEKGPNG
jgi:hypothetical protein